MRVIAALLLAWLALAPGTAVAVEPGERLDDPALEARARDLSKGLRCLVCQNQSIDDSDAGLARDLRVLVRERIAAGETNEQVIAFVTARYGDYVLLEPPVKPATLLLWYGPAAILVIGAVAVVVYVRRRNRAAPAQAGGLSDEERRRIERLLDDDAGS
jgi:cytochrome c-type biogenesis protein CcmH